MFLMTSNSVFSKKILNLSTFFYEELRSKLPGIFQIYGRKVHFYFARYPDAQQAGFPLRSNEQREMRPLRILNNNGLSGSAV